MKVLVLSQFWHPENGVPQRRWAWLSGLFVSNGGEVVVIAPPPHYRRKVSFREALKSFRVDIPCEIGTAGERIYRSPFIPAGEALFSRALSQAFIAAGALLTSAIRWSRIRDIDAVVGTVPALPTAVVSFIVSRAARVPYIIDLRDAWPDLMKEYSNWNRALETRPKPVNPLKAVTAQTLSWVVQRGLNALIKRADAVIVTSDDLGKQLSLKKGNAGCQKIVTVRNVFPSNLVVPAARTPLENRPLHVLYAGTLGRAQNLRNAIDAAEIAQSQGVPIELAFVGGGVAVSALKEYAEKKHVEAKFYRVRTVSEVASFYDWADTALVHLTDWEPLDRAVPSKTYELMAAGVHITGVVKGETAKIIRELEAGDIVPPEQPQLLADLWADLFVNPSRLIVSDRGRIWVEHERDKVVPETVDELIDWIGKLE